MIVGSSALIWSVTRKSTASPGGVSSVLSRAFCAWGVILSACSMTTVRRALSIVRTPMRLIRSRTTSTPIDFSGAMRIASG